jgi:hypothetical protein
MVVAVGIILAVTIGIFTVIRPSRGEFQSQPERADMQQRLRVVADALFKDLLSAGAGSYDGADGGSLGRFFAPVFPMRRGFLSPDAPNVFRTDAITLLSVPTTAALTTTTGTMAGPSSDLIVAPEAGCPATDGLCGFDVGTNAVVYDETGAYDTFTVAAVDGATLTIVHTPATFSQPYGVGARVARVVSVTYSVNAAAGQLMRYDGFRSDASAAENIVSLVFEYYGEAQPPALMNPGANQTVTYGPSPPQIDHAAGTFWPAGENCTFQVIGGDQAPRLAVIGGGGTTLVKLDPPMLTDGPWCPDPLNANRWDADLLRIRKVSVTARVRSVFAALGLPDQEIRFDVAPRNLNLQR